MAYADAFIGYGAEVSPGTPVTPTVWLPYVEESMEDNWEHLESEARIAGMISRPSELFDIGSCEVGGSTTHQIAYEDMGILWEAILGDENAGVFTPASTLPTLTVQVGRPDKTGTIVPKTYAGCKVSEATVEFGTGEYSTLETTFAGMKAYGFRTVTDGVTTDTDATVTSATALFTPADVGSPISGTGIPASTTILSVTSATEVELSANATASGTGVTFTIGVPAAAVTPTIARAFKFVDGGLTLDNAAGTPTATCVRSGTWTIDNGLDADRPCAGSPWRSVAAETGIRIVSGSLELEWAGRAERDRFLRQQVMSLSIPHTARGASFTIAGEIIWSEAPDPTIPSDTVLTHELAYRAVQEAVADDLATITVVEPA